MNSPNTLPLRAGLSHNSPPQRPHLCAKALDKAYPKGDQPVRVLRGVDVEVHRGEFLSVVGQSGSGKSTLMHLLGLLACPLEGGQEDRDEQGDDADHDQEFDQGEGGAGSRDGGSV